MMENDGSFKYLVSNVNVTVGNNKLLYDQEPLLKGVPNTIYIFFANNIVL